MFYIIIYILTKVRTVLDYIINIQFYTLIYRLQNIVKKNGLTLIKIITTNIFLKSIFKKLLFFIFYKITKFNFHFEIQK